MPMERTAPSADYASMASCTSQAQLIQPLWMDFESNNCGMSANIIKVEGQLAAVDCFTLKHFNRTLSLIVGMGLTPSVLIGFPQLQENERCVFRFL